MAKLKKRTGQKRNLLMLVGAVVFVILLSLFGLKAGLSLFSKGASSERLPGSCWIDGTSLTLDRLPSGEGLLDFSRCCSGKGFISGNWKVCSADSCIIDNYETTDYSLCCSKYGDPTGIRGAKMCRRNPSSCIPDGQKVNDFSNCCSKKGYTWQSNSTVASQQKVCNVAGCAPNGITVGGLSLCCSKKGYLISRTVRYTSLFYMCSDVSCAPGGAKVNDLSQCCSKKGYTASDGYHCNVVATPTCAPSGRYVSDFSQCCSKKGNTVSGGNSTGGAKVCSDN